MSMKKPLLSKISFAVLGLFVILIINSCGKSTGSGTTPATLADVITNGLISNLTSTTAQSGGIITFNGNAIILASGVCYSSSDVTPTIADSKTNDVGAIDPAGTTTYTSSITGLTAGTVYYLRAYATNSAGTAYGSVLKFTTSASISGINVTVSTLAGSIAGGFMNGSGTAALFSGPQGVATDAQGNVYVADGFNNCIREITPAGVVTTYAGNGTAGYTDGPASSAEFYGPEAVAIDVQGDLYVSDIGNSVIRKITTAGVVSTFAGNGTRGFVNGAGTVAEFNNPQGLAVDASGNVYVADRSNDLVRKITSAGVVSTFAGYYLAGYGPIAGSANGTGGNAEFNNPVAVAVDASGNVYVADQNNYSVRKITQANVVTTFAGGIVQTTLVGAPAGVATDATGNVYVTDQNGRVLEITTSSVLYILAGSATQSGYVDGAGDVARFSSPQGITVDSKGNVYVADLNNNVIRKLVVNIQ